MPAKFFLAVMKVRWEEDDGRILLGDNTRGKAITLWPIRLHCIAVWTVLLYVRGWPLPNSGNVSFCIVFCICGDFEGLLTGCWYCWVEGKMIYDFRVSINELKNNWSKGFRSSFFFRFYNAVLSAEVMHSKMI